MITFFRSIRKSLLSENKFTKYLLYALGEIILVVIGILIALQINTWNTNKNNRAKEQLYLTGYHADLERNLNELDRVIAKSNRTLSATDSLLRYAKGMLTVKDSTKVEYLVMESINYTLFLSQEGTINDIFGSGDLALIQNDTIRKSMVNWSSELKFLTEYEALGKDNQLQCINYLSKNTPFYRMSLKGAFLDEATITKIMGHQRFLNLISNQQHMANVLNALYRKQKEKMTQLLQQVRASIQ
ncbi:MAG: DUF6090 family protein [Bacteroidota bacterium]